MTKSDVKKVTSSMIGAGSITQLPTAYQNYIHVGHYGRWLSEKGRREHWDETCERYITFFQQQLPDTFSPVIWDKLYKYILHLQVMPSMRAMMTAGPALQRDNVAGYNCGFVTLSCTESFAELMYTLMCGTGVGFSVERQFIKKLPALPPHLIEDRKFCIEVADDRVAWAIAYRQLLDYLYNGIIPRYDLRQIRPKGTPLKVFGGRASGPGVLDNLFKFTIEVFKRAVYVDERLHLSSLDCHDLACMVGETVIAGGVRRSALISLSNPSDDRMREAKAGAWYDQTPWRSNANNSAAYTERPSMGLFFREWKSLYDSKSGERGIYNVTAVQQKAKESGRRKSEYHFGTNPCAEIILRDMQFCNLSEVVVRPADSISNLCDKVEVAVALGIIQSTLTNFTFLRPDWKNNCEEERLLGVSLTGIMDHPILNCSDGEDALIDALATMKSIAIVHTKKLAKQLKINMPTAITCVKPSGTVSQLVDSSSGIHARYSRYYIRRVERDKKDPICQMLIDQKFPHKQHPHKDGTILFEFPFQAAKTAVLRDTMSAIEQLELWLIYYNEWCEHKPSCTIYVGESEWMDVGAWVYEHFDKISGIAFLPYNISDTRFAGIAPYEEISGHEYARRIKDVPEIDWSQLKAYEKEDNTTGAKELACVSDACEVV